MVTITQHQCDRCGDPSNHKLPVYSLGYSDTQNSDVHCTRRAEFCHKCYMELQSVLKSFHCDWVYIQPTADKKAS